MIDRNHADSPVIMRHSDRQSYASSCSNGQMLSSPVGYICYIRIDILRSEHVFDVIIEIRIDIYGNYLLFAEIPDSYNLLLKKRVTYRKN